MNENVLQKIKHIDWSFFKGSTVVSIGIAIGRVLGLLFSLVLARAFTPQEYGAVQYAITLANIVCIPTQPFVQHVLARFVGKYKHGPELDEYLNAIWKVLTVVTLVTTIIVTPIFFAAESYNPGVIAIFIGTTFFYGYYGLARGLGANFHLLAIYLGSNIVQLIAIIVVVVGLHSQSTLLAVLIYGLSYFPPILLAQLFFPLHVGLQRQAPKRKTVFTLFKFSVPVYFTHMFYILYITVDILLLEHFQGTGDVGIYSLSKTLSAAFGFIPLGITTILMPKVAGSDSKAHGWLLRNALILTLLANGVGLVFYALLYDRLVARLFGERYVVEPAIFLVVALANILIGIHQIIASVFLGIGRAQLETISLICGTMTTIVVGVFEIPIYGAAGAAASALAGAGVSLLLMLVLVGVTSRSSRKAELNTS